MKNLAFFLTLILLTTSCTQLSSFFNIEPTPQSESTPKIVQPQQPETQPEIVQSQESEKKPEIIPSQNEETEPETALSKKLDVPLKPAPLDEDIIYPLYNRGIVVDCESHIRDIKNILGEPGSVKIEELHNPHFPSQIDEKHYLYYQGLKILVYVFEHKNLLDDTSIIIGFTLTGKQYYLPGNIKIGSPLNQVRKQIKPLTPKKNYFIYTNIFEEGYEEAIRFYFTKEKLSKVVWYCAIN